MLDCWLAYVVYTITWCKFCFIPRCFGEHLKQMSVASGPHHG